MIKRRIMLCAGAAVASLAVALSFLAINRGVKLLDTKGTDEEFSITIDADDVTTATSFESKSITVNTDQLGNPIVFDFTDVKRNGDYLEIKGSEHDGGTFGNNASKAIFGMKSIEIFGKEDAPAGIINVKWGWEEDSVVTYPYNANIYANSETGTQFDFEKDLPDYFKLVNENYDGKSVLLSKIVITYGSECKTQTSYGDPYRVINKLKYKRIGDHWEVMGFNVNYDVIADLTFEAEIEGLPVTKIADYAFYIKGDIVSVDFTGSNIVEIGSSAFYSCSNLATMTGLDQIEVFGDNCLDDAQITSITFGDNLDYIGSTILWGADKLTSVTFSDLCEPTYINSGAFNMCNAIETVHIGSLMTSVPSFAHSYNLKTYSVGPDAVHFKVDANGVLYSKDTDSTYFLKRIPMGTELTNYVVPDYVDEMMTGCAKDCVNLQSVTINNEVYVIASEAFRGCTSLHTVNFEAESKVNYIYQHAFRDCAALTTINLPSTVRTISSDVFRDCTSLASLTLPSGLTSIYAAFSGCSNLATLNYDGTKSDWGTKVTYKQSEWYDGVAATVLTCTDDTIALADAD